MKESTICKKFVVIKIGTSVAVRDGRVDRARFREIAGQVRLLMKRGVGVCLVVSGAVRLGGMRSKSLSAGIGQTVLQGALFALFQKEGVLLSQLLLTRSDFGDEKRKAHLSLLFQEGAFQGVVFLVNENDALELNSFGGNDFLASEIARLVGASHLLLLTDVEGVYQEDMQVISEFATGDAMACVSSFANLKVKGVGGIQAKIQAAQEAAQSGIETVIASGLVKNCVSQIVLEHLAVGTRFR
jgi:glutamate 5-kinase